MRFVSAKGCFSFSTQEPCRSESITIPAFNITSCAQELVASKCDFTLRICEFDYVWGSHPKEQVKLWSE